MDANKDQHPPMQGDDELAKALQGGLQFEETPVPGDQAAAASSAPSVNQSTTAPDPLAEEPPTLGMALPQPDENEMSEPAPADTEPPTIDKHAHSREDDTDKRSELVSSVTSTGSGPLDKLKASALEELRPLVGKLDLPAEEKFDTLLLIIRSTDDQSLLDEAHDAAKQISDDVKRAQALLDIIKEIDYFSSKR